MSGHRQNPGDQVGDFYTRAVEHAVLLGEPGQGWRRPQLGAIGATLSHWSLGELEPTVVSIPTGTGKTAVAMVAPFLTGPPWPSRVLMLAPARQIRRQLAEQFSTFRQLHRLGVLPERVGVPAVFEMAGRATEWSEFERFDVVVALPNSISPVHYDEGRQPPRDLFDVVIVDEAHHAPATTWRAVLDHFSGARALLLTATPRRRDGRPIPGSLQYYYPLRRALEDGLYKPITPILLTPPNPADKATADAMIAAQAADLLESGEHRTSTLLVRGATVARLHELRTVYDRAGIDLALLHNMMSDEQQRTVVDGLRAGTMRAVGVVGMLGEGFDLPSLRLVAYHDKHRSLPATVQLIGRAARVDGGFPQPSSLIAVADADVFPELQGVLRQLYEEDADWAEVLPGIIDADIRVERLNREFTERLPPPRADVDPAHLQPTKRAFVYEVPPEWEPRYLAEVPAELHEGARFLGGSVLYVGVDADAGLLVVVVRYIERPKWSSDPAMANVSYELHTVAYRKPPRVTLPGLVLLNLERGGLRRQFEFILGLTDAAQLAGPERIGDYLDSLDRISVSSVGVRSTNAATRGRATYRNFMGRSVDRGLRTIDMARSALGHVMFQVNTADGAANAGGAVEKSKVWLTRHGPLREFSEWADATAALLWFPQQALQGPLLPGMDRGHRLTDWPDSAPLAAELYPGLYGIGLQLWDGTALIGGIEDLDLYVNDDPTGTLQDVGSANDAGGLRIIGVLNDRDRNRSLYVWDVTVDVSGRIKPTRDLLVRRGYGDSASLAALFEDQPPTIYFLDGTTTIGPTRYDSRTLTSAFDPRLIDAIDWDRVDITAETDDTAKSRKTGQRSVHARLAEYLANRPRLGVNRWILHNDGSGEIADYIVVEELTSGEIHLGLWHAKAAHGSTPSVRVKDFQEVVAQALRSRRQLPSTTLWAELGARLTGASNPPATLVDGSDDADLLMGRLGLAAGDDDATAPWTRRYPPVQGTLGIVQPGLSASMLRQGLNSQPVSTSAESLRELFSVLADVARSDGAELVLVVSP
jgi:superfamily II DNA or RNA helicase